MIGRRTVLVLGAGASAPYGFPCARQLRDHILNGLSKEIAQPFQLLTAAGFDARHVINFRDALRKSGQASVDVFLEHRSEFLKVGKTAIAAALIPYEDEAKLWGGDENWYEYLWQHLGPSLMDDVAQSQLSIVTFNYDRSLEHFLFSALKESHNIGIDDAARYLREVIRIVHVHGQLGPLPYADHGTGDGRAYRPVDPANLKDAAVAAARGIKIVHESAKNDPAYVQARELLSQAEIVIFLGFGYLKGNLERLGIPSLSPNIGLTGTAYGLVEGERAEVGLVVSQRISLGNMHHGVLEFLRTHRLLI